MMCLKGAPGLMLTTSDVPWRHIRIDLSDQQCTSGTHQDRSRAGGEKCECVSNIKELSARVQMQEVGWARSAGGVVTPIILGCVASCPRRSWPEEEATWRTVGVGWGGYCARGIYGIWDEIYIFRQRGVKGLQGSGRPLPDRVLTRLGRFFT
ncbi:hypothetical protein VNO78_08025 [Psophocarpus tetragonolobus]|uniref:Uncharacterized protein n=1 Tax=Psophocarpus tetragonolobus TaxID=3891 RepID=A0AAN9XTB5_PSOTE